MLELQLIVQLAMRLMLVSCAAAAAGQGRSAG